MSARDPLASLIGEMSDGALIARSVDGVILEVNRKLCDMFRVSGDLLVGQDAGRFLPLAELGHLQGEAVHRECKVTRSDGSQVRVDISLTPLQNGDFMAILRESADRRMLRNGTIDEANFRAFFYAAPLPMLILDRENLKIVDANDAASELYRYNREQFLRLHLADLSPVEDVPRLLIRWSAASPETHELGEWRHLTKDGESITVRLISREVQTTNRNSVMVVSLPMEQQNLPISPSEPITDVTRAILDVISSPTIATDPAGRLIQFNRAAENLTGCKAAEVLGRPVWDIFLEGEAADKMRGEFERQHFPVYFENQWHLADESVRDLAWSSTVVRDEHDAISHIVSSATDNTALRAAESALRKLCARLFQTHDNERRNLARYLHDTIAQSLAALSMSLSLGANDPKSMQSNLTLLERCCRDVRTFSYMLHEPLFDELGLPAASKWYLEGYARDSGLKIDFQADPAFARLPPELEHTLMAVLKEGISNVRRHSGSSDAIVRLNRDAHGASVEVEDHGCGLPGEIERSLASGTIDNGVGLIAIRERLTQNSGSLEIFSSPKGTRLRASVPVRRN
ncbi:MAG TPA: PAS domain S-box protein [Bryobacteraceae bacterium]|jgi:PAS domain S-box-containing protein